MPIDHLDPASWTLLILVAFFSFWAGRLTAPRTENAAAAAQEAEAVISSIDPSKLSEVDRLILENKKIAAIRLVRVQTGVGLRAAKLAVDRRAKEITPER